MPDPLLAHTGHWVSGLIYLAPVALIVAFLAVQHVKGRRDPDAAETFEEPTLDDVMDGKHPLQ